MSLGPEARFWSSVRASKPANVLLTRIENRHGGGVPDVHGIVKGLPFWLELKVQTGKSVKISTHQIAWHTAFCAKGGLSFFLVKTPIRGASALFHGRMACELAQMQDIGLLEPCFTDLGAMWAGLEARVWDHYRELCGPAA